MDLSWKKESDRRGVVDREGQSLQSTLRRGWYWGAQNFREQLLERFGREAKTKRNRDDKSSPMMREFGVREAEAIIEEAVKHFGAEEEWKESRRGDKRKAAVAWAICQRTNLRH